MHQELDHLDWGFWGGDIAESYTVKQGQKHIKILKKSFGWERLETLPHLGFIQQKGHANGSLQYIHMEKVDAV